MAHDLLRPPQLTEHYTHQLRQTIAAYHPANTVLGEALQNAIDAVVQAGGGKKKISLALNLDARTVTIRDDGLGFPNDPTLLFLGGSSKRIPNKKLFGLVGVGIKVVLFQTDLFRLRSRTASGSSRIEVQNAYRFDQDPPPNLEVPDSFPSDPEPLDSTGTELHYRFPAGLPRDPLARFVNHLREESLPRGIDKDFGKTLQLAVDEGRFANRFSALFYSYLLRNLYAGDVAVQLGQKPELADTEISVVVSCSDPASHFGDAAELFDDQAQAQFTVKPHYLGVEDTRLWVPTHERPGLFFHELGPGGTNLTRTFKGFNVTRYTSPEDYDKLLRDAKGNLPKDIDEYRTHLYPHINGILLTIGRIPLFEEFLPGGSRRVLSANGVVTSHELDLTRGRNQEYVRCFDLVIDVDAPLNYGKTQLTDMHLVNRVRRFVNDAYVATIQAAAGNWVGKIKPPDEDEAFDDFLARPPLGLEDFILQRQPTDETDVIALFFELAGKGHFAGYRVFGLSQSDKYDSRALIQRTGDKDERPVPTNDRQLDVVEFKLHAASIIHDFMREAKDPGEVHLLIAWDEGQLTSEQYGFADIEHSYFYPKKQFPKVQRYLQDTKSGKQIQVLLLKPIVEKLRKGEPIG